MSYHTSASVTGDPSQFMNVALSTLTMAGFRVSSRSEHNLTLKGPGWNSTHESGLTGASAIHLAWGSGRLELNAELGGVDRMKCFLLLFPIGILAVVFVAVASAAGLTSAAALTTGGNLLLWMAVVPLMIHWQRRRTCRALDALLVNSAAAGG